MGTLIALPQSEQYTFPPRLSLPTKKQQALLSEEEEAHESEGNPSFMPSSQEEEPASAAPTMSPVSTSEVLDRDMLRAHMITHSLKGNKQLKVRTPFVGEVVPVTSSEDPEVEFGIKRVGNREVMIHRDRNAVVRYVQRDGAEEFVSEKDYPVGSMRVDTVAMCLESWNIADPSGHAVKIDREAILSYLQPEELDFLYEKCLEINPILGAGGKEARKND